MYKTDLFFDNNTRLDKFQKDYFRNRIETNFLLLSKSRINSTLSFIGDICESEHLRDCDVKESISSTWNFRDDFPWCKDEELFIRIYSEFLKSIVTLCTTTRYWEQKDIVQNHIISKLICTVASLHEDGITHGYLSFYSNYLYYLSQLKVIADDESFRKIKNNMEIIGLNDEKFLENDVEIFPDVFETLKTIRDLLESNISKLNINALPDPYTFFDNGFSELEYSDFHKQVFTNDILLKRYSKFSFAVYRIVMGLFFKILPLLGVGMNRRNHIIFISVRHIEKNFDINWETQINESIRMEK